MLCLNIVALTHILHVNKQEHSTFEKDPLSYCKISVDENDLFHWKCLMEGPPDTPYAGGTFNLDIQFPAQYPFKPPTIKFVTKVYHPAVETETGRICADAILASPPSNTDGATTSSSSSGWGPTLNVRHCLGALYDMLRTPSSFDHTPLEESIATLLRDKPKEFEKNAKKYTKDYAK
jgi:ubiquitin-protein ligase